MSPEQSKATHADHHLEAAWQRKLKRISDQRDHALELLEEALNWIDLGDYQDRARSAAIRAELERGEAAA